MYYAHQKLILDEDKKKCGLFLGTGSGKTRIALSLARGKTLVVAPKTQVLDGNWEREYAKIPRDIELTVISKERFKRDHEILSAFDTLIFDEAHTILGATPRVRYKNRKPIPAVSQIFAASCAYVERVKPERLYLVTATPTRSAMCVWAAGTLLGKKWNFYEFRDAFYVKLPMIGREVWIPKVTKDVKERLGAVVRKLGYTGRLDDWFDVPPQTHITVECPLTKKQHVAIEMLPLEYPDPIVLLGKQHQVENGILMRSEFVPIEYFDNAKIDKILDIIVEYPKVLIFAKYREQIEQIANAVKEHTEVYVMTGETKDREGLIRAAEASTACVFICQSQISAGFELPSFRCTVFASASYSYVDLVQAQGRTLRANNLQKNLYLYLSSGEIDKAVWRALDQKEDFSEHIYAKKRG